MSPAVTASGDIAVAFAAVLREQGVAVAVGQVVTFAHALDAVGLAERASVYWAGRTALLVRPEDVAAFDVAFGRFWLQREPMTVTRPVPPVVLAVDIEPPPDADGDDDPAVAGTDVRAVRYSAREVLRHKDFAAYTHAEHAEARRLMADLRLAGALRRSRRLVPVRGGGNGRRPDLRRTVRAGLRTGGELVDRRWRGPSSRPRRTVLLCDVSGSMEPYARALLRFMHAAVSGGTRVEAFALGTRLTRLTRELSRRDPDAALDDAGRAVPDWSGGTRLGDGLREFNDRWGVRGMARGANVVVLSDGWDRGDTAVLAEEMARLQRVARRIVWVNPLKVSPGYAPLARGMAAALPYVDDFVEGHSLAALEELIGVVKR